MKERRSDALVVFAVALGVRLLLALWGGSRFPPADDGIYYDTFAHRLSHGQGYTWLWPDGVVTAASHYPVGYPMLVSLAYRVAETTTAAMVVNALFGAVAVPALMLSLREAGRRTALVAGLVFAFDPALLPYTLVTMTEGVTTSLLVIAFAFAMAYRANRTVRYLACVGITMGLATLVRPQCLLLAPLIGFVAVPSGRKATLVAAAVVTGLTLLVCSPWTVRNCLDTDKCSLVSANGGWNLLIGAQTKTGGWSEIQVPDECKDVFQEGAKDTCFGSSARRQITHDLAGWLARAPAKLGQTFNFLSPAPGYLQRSNAAAISSGGALLVSTLQTVLSRVLLIVALLTSASQAGPRMKSRKGVAALGVLAALTLYAYLGYLALAAVVLLLGAEIRTRPLHAWTAGLIAATAATHAVFFGAGRYGLVVVPFVSAIAVMGMFGGRSSAEAAAG